MVVLEQSSSLRQRADYTHRYNAKTGRHGWLRLTPAYSLKIVEEIIGSHPDSVRILDPFCGTGTTALTAAYYGHETITTDINPFLLWLAKAKTRIYTAKEINNTKKLLQDVVRLTRSGNVKLVTPPAIHNIERWWSKNSLNFLTLLQSAIREVAKENPSEQTLLQVAFCRTLIHLSNASFNHQSMSFKDTNQLQLDLQYDEIDGFVQDVNFILTGASENPPKIATVLHCDAKDVEKVANGNFDLVITSPPYVNRMSYIRELRPYMYWLGYLSNGRDAGELDWSAIGGTWGIATSRLTEWERPKDHFKNKRLETLVGKIAHADNKNGALLSKYVIKYFDDMWIHFKGLTKVLASGAETHYIIGNSTFYGNLVPAETFYADMLSELGFTDVTCSAIRKRNSKKELVEFDVSAIWK